MPLSKPAAWGRTARRSLLGAVLTSLCLLTVLTTTAAAAPQTATDWFTGVAIIPPGQTSPVQVDPRDLTVRADGAVGLGYTYQATGRATGQLPGAFHYEEHGYLYFSNPTDPSTLVGSRFTSGLFALLPDGDRTPVQIIDTAPDTYTSGIQTAINVQGPRLRHGLKGLLGPRGPLTYGYFTFTDGRGTFTGYATPDFSHFAIQITFDVPHRLSQDATVS
jgi:hypothetical protein